MNSTLWIESIFIDDVPVARFTIGAEFPCQSASLSGLISEADPRILFLLRSPDQVIRAEALSEHALEANEMFLVHADLRMGLDRDQPEKGYRFHDVCMRIAHDCVNT